MARAEVSSAAETEKEEKQMAAVEDRSQQRPQNKTSQRTKVTVIFSLGIVLPPNGCSEILFGFFSGR